MSKLRIPKVVKELAKELEKAGIQVSSMSTGSKHLEIVWSGKGKSIVKRYSYSSKAGSPNAMDNYRRAVLREIAAQ